MFLKALLYYNISMALFQHQLWGYQILLPDGWQHKRFGSRDGFALDLNAFKPNYQGDTLAQLLIHGEWNSLGKPVLDIWHRHLGKISLMLGAKNLASAPWEMAGAKGQEVEIILPHKNPQRLWTGILENGMLVLSFMALHWKDSREEMEPVLSRIIASLEYLQGVEDLQLEEAGVPLPSGAAAVNPRSIVDDISDPENWRAFHTEHSLGALQAFYLRELPRLSWEIKRFIPFPNPSSYPFARVIIKKDHREVSLGLLPDSPSSSAGNIVLREITG
jgi:hypothetical protein